MSDLVLRWQNIPRRVGDRLAREQVEFLADGVAHVVALGEAAHVAGKFKVPGYRWDLNPDHLPLPMLVRNDVDIQGREHLRAYPPTKVGSWGAGPSRMTAGWDHGLTIAVPGVEPVEFMSGHLVPSVMRTATNPLALIGRRKRRRLHLLEVEQIAAASQRTPRFVAVADWNCRTSYDGTQPLWDAGLEPVVTSRPTHGGSGFIDWFAVKGVEVVGNRRLERGPSDHFGIELKVR